MLPDRARLWRPAPHLDLELLEAAFSRYTFRKHTHDTFCVGAVVSGRAQLMCSGKDYAFGPESVVMINPGEVHDGGPAPEHRVEYRNLYISVDALAEITRQVSDTLPTELAFHHTVANNAFTAGRLQALFATLERGGPRLAIESALVTELGPILLEYARVPPPPTGRQPGAGLARVREALHAAPSRDYSLNDLSAIAQLSAYHLVRSFHDAYGLPPAAYQRDLRLRKAKRRLHGDVSIATVAAECGFCDQAHLGRWFKRTYGVTPAAYRRAVTRPTVTPPSPPPPQPRPLAQPSSPS